MQSWALGFFCAVALLAMVASSQNGSAIALNPNEQRNMEQGEKGGGVKRAGRTTPHAWFDHSLQLVGGRLPCIKPFTLSHLLSQLMLQGSHVSPDAIISPVLPNARLSWCNTSLVPHACLSWCNTSPVLPNACLSSSTLHPLSYLMLVSADAIHPLSYLILVSADAIHPLSYLMLVSADAIHLLSYRMLVSADAIHPLSYRMIVSADAIISHVLPDAPGICGLVQLCQYDLCRVLPVWQDLLECLGAEDGPQGGGGQ